MHRRNREFKTESSELEGRTLLSGVHMVVQPPIVPPTVFQPSVAAPIAMFLADFDAPAVTSSGVALQVVTQQSGEATLKLNRPDTSGSLQVQVMTLPSPNVGVNVAAVNQTVTFPDGQAETTLTVPILPGAPNPGEVDVTLVVRPVDPAPNETYFSTSELDLRILGSDPALPPKVVSTYVTSQGIVLNFDKPMDPVSASNLKNYEVTAVNADTHTTGGLFGGLFKTSQTRTHIRSLKIFSAQYDPATQSVTLTTQAHAEDQEFTRYAGVEAVNVSLSHAAQRPDRPGTRLKAAGNLVDAQGNLINSDSTPGKVEIRLSSRTSTSGPGALDPFTGFA
jgi:hypothetical protein